MPLPIDQIDHGVQYELEDGRLVTVEGSTKLTGRLILVTVDEGIPEGIDQLKPAAFKEKV